MPRKGARDQHGQYLAPLELSPFSKPMFVAMYSGFDIDRIQRKPRRPKIQAKIEGTLSRPIADIQYSGRVISGYQDERHREDAQSDRSKKRKLVDTHSVVHNCIIRSMLLCLHRSCTSVIAELAGSIDMDLWQPVLWLSRISGPIHALARIQ